MIPNEVLLGLMVVFGAVAIWGALRSVPALVARQQRGWEARIGEVEGEWRRSRAELLGILEQLEATAETLEKRRARITSENRRASQRIDDPAAEEGADPKLELRRIAGLV